MKILASLICDSANDYNGKLCILGAFDSLKVKNVPTALPHCAIALRINFTCEDQGEHNLEVGFLNSDEKAIIPEDKKIKLKFNLAPLPAEIYFASSNIIINLQNINLPKRDYYNFDIKIDSKPLVRIPIQVL